ncbi:Kelch repeat-containing protein [Pseudobacteriovorax antillogorgiicola]|uniref:Kelch motif-containing protein n=1 Tax=Pseudobacteriovorax antillogorgiicola TaxID=1513793 RepID=A0A1Y6CQ96_9BACT|nr:kelch repeat-containing protein [Pseudobacteriovorax antillogorgiicola]TCS42741.1 Kelch motif protein [Pseudobacteriovorax antillogorgiicola]SMF82208.1 Kelch motif-containing protein [Pseudobacteriovorax antillogorgiicola]
MKFLYMFLILKTLGCVTTPKNIGNDPLSWKGSTSSDLIGGLALHQCFSYQNKILVFGGVRDDIDHDPYNNKAFLFDLKSEEWIVIRPMTERLSQQRLGGGQAGIVAAGGITNRKYMSRNTYLLDPENLAWIEASYPELDPRVRHSMVYTEGHLVVIIGGENHKKERLNWGVYDLIRKKVKVLPTPKAGGKLVSHVAEPMGRNVFVWGGFQNNKRSNDGFIVFPDNSTWEKVAPSPLSPRSNARSVSFGNQKVLIWGGANPERDSNSGAIYDGLTNSWRSVPSIPDKRYSVIKNPSLTLVDETSVLLWGGRFETHEFSNDGWILDLRLLRWKRFPQKGVPEGRMHHCMLKHGNALFLFGGIGGEPSALKHFRVPYVLDFDTSELELQSLAE